MAGRAIGRFKPADSRCGAAFGWYKQRRRYSACVDVPARATASDEPKQPDCFSGVIVLDTAGDIRFVASVDAISAMDWDAIVGPRDLFGSHAWLRHLHQAVA